MLQQYMSEEGIEVAAIMEPVCIPENDNWISSKDGKAVIHWKTRNLRTQCERIMHGGEFVALKLYDMVIVACYISPKYKIEEFEDALERMENDIGMLETENVIICGDFNAHAILWGSKFASNKGRKLKEWMEGMEMVLMNEGNIPTCVRPQGESIVDLTWSTSLIANRIKVWRVEEEKVSLSNHYYITFSVDDNKGREIGKERERNKHPRWKIKEMDLDLFGEVLEWKSET